jgi:hypothetical protein
LLEVDCTAQRTSDEALDFLGATIDWSTGAAVAWFARLAGVRKH